MNRISALFLAAFALGAPKLAAASTWEIDAGHSAAAFSVRHLMVSNVRGELGKVTGTVHLDDKDISRSTVEATIDATALSTRDDKRDQHLKGADFFDVARFPKLTFKSKQVQPAGPGKLKVIGDLTLHGVTREVALQVEGPATEVKDPWGNTKSGASATARLNRKDFGMSWNKALDAGGVAVADEVTVNIELELVKK